MHGPCMERNYREATNQRSYNNKENVTNRRIVFKGFKNNKLMLNTKINNARATVTLAAALTDCFNITSKPIFLFFLTRSLQVILFFWLSYFVVTYTFDSYVITLGPYYSFFMES